MLTTNCDLKTVQRLSLNQKLPARVELFKHLIPVTETTYSRTVLSAAGREVMVRDPFDGQAVKMLMFASNNYLGLADHPRVNKAVINAVREYGSGIGGPPLLNGYSRLIEQTEERLANFKGQEAAILYSSGFMANLGVVSGLAGTGDIILYDELSHASFFDAIKMTKARSLMFPHNDMDRLDQLLSSCSETPGSVFVCVEGVYSMDGDLAPLNDIAALCRKHDAVLIVDDAHGTGVLGTKGKGTADHFNCSDDVQVTMGTFSKVFSVSGGFLTCSRDIVNYLRFHSRPYIFSASLPPAVVAAVLAGIDVIEEEPWLQTMLHDNVAYAVNKLKSFEFCAKPQAGIIALKLAAGMNIRAAALLFHQKGIFINPIEYPAVQSHNERFRISLMAQHTRCDIDRLCEAVEEVWNDPAAYF